MTAKPYEMWSAAVVDSRLSPVEVTVEMSMETTGRLLTSPVPADDGMRVSWPVCCEALSDVPITRRPRQGRRGCAGRGWRPGPGHAVQHQAEGAELVLQTALVPVVQLALLPVADRSEEHTSELQSQSNLVCRLLLEKKKKTYL